MKRKLRIVFLLWGVIFLASFFAIWALGMMRDFGGIARGVFIFLFASSLATVLVALGYRRESLKKERDELGNTKPLLRNYLLLGLLVFTMVTGMSFLDLFHGAQYFLSPRIRVQKISSSPVEFIKLTNILPAEEKYLFACLEITKALKTAGAKAVLIPLSADFTPSQENYPVINELINTGIIVFGVQPARFGQNFQGEWVANHPTNLQIEVPWGVATGEPHWGSLQYVPYEFWVLSSVMKVGDFSLELVKKYAGYSNDLEIKRVKNHVELGDYTIPVFVGGYTYATTRFETPDSTVRADYDKKTGKIQYSLCELYSWSMESSTSSRLESIDFLKDKIVLIYPWFVSNHSYRNLQDYKNIILDILTGNLVLPLDDWNVLFIFLSIVFAGWICYKLPPMTAAITLSSSVIALLFGGLFLLYQYNVFVETPYMIISVGLCLTLMPISKFVHKKRNLEEQIVLELERKQVLESQKGELEKQVAERTSELQTEKEKSDHLLYNILPKEIADGLKESGVIPAKRFEEVSILFTDFRGFTATVASVPASRLVDELNDIFHHVDDIVESYGLEKIKTIGDAYMAVAGLPKESNNHAIQTVKAALEILRYIDERNKTSFIKWEMRTGIHSGTVVAGVVGKWKFTYDIWGDAVNIANRMESSGVPGRVNISAFTYDLVKNQFNCEYRGKIDAKGKGEIDMYFVLEEKNSSTTTSD